MEESTLDEFDQAVMIVRNFESLSPIARAMVIGKFFSILQSQKTNFFFRWIE